MNITDMTTYSDIRAVLGVSEEEIEDADLAQPVWSGQLTMRLYELWSEFEDTFLTVKAIAAVTQTPEQKRFILCSQLYASYIVAEELLGSLPMFAFVRLTDGKAETQRFDKWEDVKLAIKGSSATMRLRLIAATVALNIGYSPAAATVRIPMSAVGLAVNPVTGV